MIVDVELLAFHFDLTDSAWKDRQTLADQGGARRPWVLGAACCADDDLTNVTSSHSFKAVLYEGRFSNELLPLRNIEAK